MEIIKALPVPHALGEIVAGFGQRVSPTDEKVNSGSIVMGTYVGKFTLDPDTEVEVSSHIVGGGLSFRLKSKDERNSRRFDLDVSKVFDFIRADFLSPDLEFQKDTDVEEELSR